MEHIIQWFPGHMAKARREASEQIKKVDVVLELRDARIPESSANPIIEEIIGNKATIIVLNKADMANPQKTQEWLAYYSKEGHQALAIDAQHNQGLGALKKMIQEMMSDYFESMEAKGVKRRPIRLLILGTPNVGKSTLINRFVGKNQAITGNKPGVTKAQRWLKIKKEFELLDTPGILWPKFEDPLVAQKLAMTRAIKESLLHLDDIALLLLEYIRRDNPNSLERYQISQTELEDLSTVDLLLAITKNMGFKEDYDLASERLLNDFNNKRLGQYTLDTVPVDIVQ